MVVVTVVCWFTGKISLDLYSRWICQQLDFGGSKDMQNHDNAMMCLTSTVAFKTIEYFAQSE